jgi:chromate reductase
MAGHSILTICGSLRKGSLNQMIINTLPELAPEGMTFVDAPPIGEMPLYNADIQNNAGFPQSVTALADAIRAADGVIFVSPEYNYSVPGVLKNAIDWVSRVPEQPFKNKPVAMQSASGGMLGGARMQYHLRQIMVFVDALAMNKPEVFVTFAAKKVDAEAGRITDEASRDVIRDQLAGFAQFIEKVR